MSWLLLLGLIGLVSAAANDPVTYSYSRSISLPYYQVSYGIVSPIDPSIYYFITPSAYGVSVLNLTSGDILPLIEYSMSFQWHRFDWSQVWINNDFVPVNSTLILLVDDYLNNGVIAMNPQTLWWLTVWNPPSDLYVRQIVFNPSLDAFVWVLSNQSLVDYSDYYLQTVSLVNGLGPLVHLSFSVYRMFYHAASDLYYLSESSEGSMYRFDSELNLVDQQDDVDAYKFTVDPFGNIIYASGSDGLCERFVNLTRRCVGPRSQLNYVVSQATDGIVYTPQYYIERELFDLLIYEPSQPFLPILSSSSSSSSTGSAQSSTASSSSSASAASTASSSSTNPSSSSSIYVSSSSSLSPSSSSMTVSSSSTSLSSSSSTSPSTSSTGVSSSMRSSSSSSSNPASPSSSSSAGPSSSTSSNSVDTSSSTSSSSSSGGATDISDTSTLSSGAIAGIVIGTISLIAIVTFAGYYWFRTHNKSIKHRLIGDMDGSDQELSAYASA